MVVVFSRKVVNMWKTSSVAYLIPPDPGQPDAWTTETKGRGTQRLEVGSVGAPPLVAEALGVPIDAHVVARTRVLSVAGKPVEVAVSYYPPNVAEGTALAREAPIKGGAVRLLADLGYLTHRAVEDVSADGAAPEIAGALGVTPGFPVLLTQRTSYTSDDLPFECMVSAASDGRRQRYVLELA